MKINTHELSGISLEWAVSASLARDRAGIKGGYVSLKIGDTDTLIKIMAHSKDGRIIEREKISIYEVGRQWEVRMGIVKIGGPTPYIAAARCLVATVFGDEVDVPMPSCLT